jgi:hypothetical protein
MLVTGLVVAWLPVAARRVALFRTPLDHACYFVRLTTDRQFPLSRSGERDTLPATLAASLVNPGNGSHVVEFEPGCCGLASAVASNEDPREVESRC